MFKQVRIKKVNVVSVLRLKYDLKIFFKISSLVKSIYYCTLSKTNKDDKNKEIIDKIKEILNNKEGYDYHRITLDLKKTMIKVNHKKFIE